MLVLVIFRVGSTTLYVLGSPLLSTSFNRKENKNPWTRQSGKLKWSNLDYQLEGILEATLKGDVDRKMETMTAVVYITCKEMFGVKQAKNVTRTSVHPNISAPQH